jgi:hypothetical protein
MLIDLDVVEDIGFIIEENLLLDLFIFEIFLEDLTEVIGSNF